MQIQETTKPTRRRSAPRLIAAGLLALVVAIASSGLVAFGAFHNNGADGLQEVGPIASETGFPAWYRDTTGKRLELCLDVDSHCLLTSADVPAPTEPLSVYTGNFPGEAFWFAGDSFIEVPNGANGALILALEAAFASGETPIPGDQVAFGRVRIRIDNLQLGQTYKVTHPYGSDTFVADAPDPKNAGRGEINFTEDIGIGSWAGPLSSRIGPFLTAVSPAPPAGYIGSPNVEQTVTGSPYNTNYFMIEGPGVRSAATDPGACPGRASDLNCVYNDLFALAGKYATNAGVDIESVLYSRDSAGQTILNVYAKSESLQAIQVDGPDFAVTNATANGGSYYARIPLGNTAPTALVKVLNQSDKPVASKEAAPIDIVTISRAEYDTATRALTIEAASSDAYTNPTLSLDGYSDAFVNGTLVIANLDAPPLYATVRSSAKGWDTEQVRVVGPGYEPLPVLANPGTIQTVTSGAPVALDGTGSQGEISGWQWTQIDNGAPMVSLSNANTAIATFVAPPNPSDTVLVLRFRLTVQGPGGPSSDTVNVRVRPGNALPVARAGADQNVLRGSVVTVDASASTNALTYSWVQVSGPAVVLSSPNSARTSFTYPQATGTVVLDVTATGPGGSDTDRVRIVPLVDTLAIASAQFTRGSNEWRVRGTALAAPGNVAYIYNGTTCPVGGGTTNTLFATVTVDALGDWEFRGTGPAINGQNRVSVCTLGGARVLNFAVRIR